MLHNTIVRPFRATSPESQAQPHSSITATQSPNHTTASTSLKFCVEIEAPSAQREYTADRMKELCRLSNRKIVPIFPQLNALEHRIYRSRFDDQVKFERTQEWNLNSLLVQQIYNQHHHGLLTHARTVQRSSQRLLMCLAPVLLNQMKPFGLYQLDVSQAYA